MPEETTLTIQPGEVATVDTTEGIKIDIRNDGAFPMSVRLVDGKLSTHGIARSLEEVFHPLFRNYAIEGPDGVRSFLGGISARREEEAANGDVRRDSAGD